MTTPSPLYFCACVHPIVDVDSPGTCRRCLLDVSPHRIEAEGLRDASSGSRRAELVARRQEFVDRASSSSFPSWDDDAGSVDARVLAGVAVLALAALVVVVAWHWLVGAGVVYAAYRHLTRGTRRRRPRSSWSSIGRTIALGYASWNSRGLVHRNGRPLRVSVPAKAGREHRDEYGDIPF